MASITDILSDILKRGMDTATRGRERGGSGRGSGRRLNIPKIDLPAVGRRSGARRQTTAQRIDVPRRPAAPRADARRGEMPTGAARIQIAYEPRSDGDADPGEVVWTWVPYEDDPSQGKDRPVIVIGHVGDDVAALQLTSQAHSDRHHHALGSGPWDRRGRPSWVKLDRVLRLDPDGIRREGSVLDEARFSSIVAALQAY